jgi:methylated-DNA-[protein]-cysteine S-methyltransferase
MDHTRPQQSCFVFDTELGFVGIAWSRKGLARLCLFQRDRSAVEGRLARSNAAAVDGSDLPPWVAALVNDIRRYAEGVPTDFSRVPLDLEGIDGFRLAIYEATRTLGYGQTTTYGELARLAGHDGAARETGRALGANPVPLIVPCHRVTAAGGRIGGFSAPGGSVAKQRMLALEGAAVATQPQQSFAF